MQTIITKYLGPTNQRGSRIKASQSASYFGRPKSITIGWDYALSTEQNHRAAAMAFAAKMDWTGNWACGDNGSAGYVFVNTGVSQDARMTFNQERTEAA